MGVSRWRSPSCSMPAARSSSDDESSAAVTSPPSAYDTHCPSTLDSSPCSARLASSAPGEG
eukprot:scaffold27988_cov55-Phaeocystis_antarctica.AAC.1